MKKIYLFLILFSVFFGCLGADVANAYLVEDLNIITNGNMIIGPGKTEIMLSPGDSYTMEVTATNATGEAKIIKFSTEDIAASNDPETTLEFLGTKTGPYSLKDYVTPEIDTLTLEPGQRVRMPVTITVPEDASPGGLYGSIMVSAESLPTEVTVEVGKVSGQVSLITRVAVLLFVRIEGDVLESSYLKDFTVAKNFYEKGPVTFNITSANTGNVYLSPHGSIEIKDMIGRVIDAKEIDAWFTLPKSERTREILWNSNFLFGRYTAVLSLYRGYMNTADNADTATITFWVLPWKIILIGLISLILIIWLLVWIFSHIQWKKAPQNPVPPVDPSSPNPPSSNPPTSTLNQ
jgi:hypothetical protein